MFKSSPVQDTEQRKALCARLGAEFHPGDMAYRVEIDGEEAGIVTFFIKGKKGCLRQIVFYEDKQDFEVMFISSRACMNFMDEIGANEGYFISPAEDQQRLVTALGYKKQPDGSFYLNTDGFFIEHCKNHDENVEASETTS